MVNPTTCLPERSAKGRRSVGPWTTSRTERTNGRNHTETRRHGDTETRRPTLRWPLYHESNGTNERKEPRRHGDTEIRRTRRTRRTRRINRRPSVISEYSVVHGSSNGRRRGARQRAKFER